MTSFEIHDWVRRGNELLKRGSATLASGASDEFRELASRMPTQMTDGGDRALRLVFAGQYSAGKSSILRALTGRDDIDVGEGITTQESHEYDWDGVKVIDTPGVHTSLRPDHDAAAYEQISAADLLVFVTTNEGLDSHLAAHFRTLAIDRDKAHEMMLVVNKMQRAAAGNTPQAQDVIRADLSRLLTPFTAEELRTSFIDTEAFLDAQEEDEEFKESLLRKSGYAQFISNLNAFIREKGIVGRYTSSLYVLEQVLQEALASEPGGDDDVNALEELLLQQRRAVLDTQQRVPRDVSDKVQRAAAKFRASGREVADLIHANADSEDVNNRLQVAQAGVQTDAAALASEVERVVQEHLIELDQRLREVTESELARELLPRLVARMKLEMERVDVDVDTLGKAQKGANAGQRLGEFLVQNSFNSSATSFGGLFKLNQYSGTNAHEAVKVLGKFFGKSFRPWEAVKWARTVANVGRAFAVVGVVLSFIFQVKADMDAEKLEADLLESRAAVRTGFNEAALSVDMHFDEVTKSFVASTLAPHLAGIDEQLAALRAMRTSQSDLFSGLVGLLEDTRALVREMHEMPEA